MSRVYSYFEELAIQDENLDELCKKCRKFHHPLQSCEKDRRKITSKKFDSVIEKIIKESANENK